MTAIRTPTSAKRYVNIKTYLIYNFWAYSSTYRITGFGPVDGGSIPPAPVSKAF